MLRLSAQLRRKRLERFLHHMKLSSNASILDVGGSGTWNWDAISNNVSITILNIHDPLPNCKYRYVKGNACDMHMFEDGEFDIVFSNSVIEHLQSRTEQQKMAAEIQRVGRAYWIQTPNKHFPLELHLLFPFIQYFPERYRVAFAKVWCFSFQKMMGHSAEDDARALLLTKKTFRSLFPNASMISEKIMFIDKSLIAYGETDA